MAIVSRPIIGLRIGERLQAVEPPAPSCAYPLDASESEVQSVGFDQKLPMSDGDQLATHQFIANAGSLTRHSALPSGLGSGQTIDVTDGGPVVAVAVDLTNTPDLSGGDNDQVVGQLFGPADSYVLSTSAPAGILVFNTDGSYDVAVKVIPGTGDVVATPTSPPKQICCYFRWTDVNGSPEAEMGLSILHADDTTEDTGWQRFVADTSVVPGLFFSNSASETQFADGLDVPFRFVTTASEIKCPVPAGAVDPCGNTI